MSYKQNGELPNDINVPLYFEFGEYVRDLALENKVIKVTEARKHPAAIFENSGSSNMHCNQCKTAVSLPYGGLWN